MWRFLLPIIAISVIGFTLLIFLKKKRNTFKNISIYFLLRAVIIGLFLTPTIYGIGHGAIPTNGISGIFLVFYAPGEEYKLPAMIAFGRKAGGTVFLLPCYATFLFSFVVNYLKYRMV